MKRLDVYLAENHICRSRSVAVRLIKKGCVLVDGKKICQPSFSVADTAQIVLTDDAAVETEFVGRGGKKLKKALSVFDIDLSGAVCIDIGASTGGFTDCMLQNGAERVYAVDVGTGQLAPSLCRDPRVVNMEKTNIRSLNPDSLEKADFISCDVSFISLKYVFPVMQALLKPTGCAVCLVKPQFEAGKNLIGKNGIVKDPKIHQRVLLRVMNEAQCAGLVPLRLAYSPIRGGDGNIEYLLYLRAQDTDEAAIDIQSVVASAHRELEGECHAGGN